jgi:hypothetical protein
MEIPQQGRLRYHIESGVDGFDEVHDHPVGHIGADVGHPTRDSTPKP